MAINVKSQALGELIDTGAEVERLATGFTFTEGPIWNKDGNYLLFSDMPGDVRRRWSEQDGVEEVMRPSNKCNGMVYDSGGNLLVCEHVTSSLVRERPDGSRETLATHYQGKELNSPNDVVTRSDGTIYFSDPSFGRMPGFGLERDQELAFQGVYRIAAGGGEPELALPEDEFEQPNGLCFSPDESLMYINDTPRALIRVYNVQPDGTLIERPPVLRRHRQRRDRGGHPGRDEVRRARQHLGHRPGRRMGDLGRGRAPRRRRGARERRQSRLGRRRLEGRSTCRARRRCTASGPRSPSARLPTTRERRDVSEEPLRLDPKRSALIIQDLQNDVIIEGGAFADSGAPAHAKSQNVVENVARLAEAARAAGTPVIHVHYIVEEGAVGLKQNAPLFQGVKEAGALVRGIVGRGAGRGAGAANRRPRRGEDADERVLRHAAGHPAARARRRDDRDHWGLDEHVDRAHRASRRGRRL